MTFFKKLKWIPFTDELKINKCCMVLKSLNELATSYVAEKFVTVSQTSSQTSRYGKKTFVFPKYNREMEGGKSFLISAAKLWNSITADLTDHVQT